MRLITLLTTVLAVLAMHSASAFAEEDGLSNQERLKRVYQMRMRLEQDRARRDNEARANVRLVTQGSAGSRVDSPTVTSLRRDTNQQLARFEQNLRCLGLEVENNGGNTVVVCDDNNGDIDTSNVTAGRDILTIQGGQQ